MIPGEVLALIRDTPTAVIPGTPAESLSCAGAKFHSPRPMLLHPFELPGGTIHLCGTCADNVQLLMELLKAREGEVPWKARRCFGNIVRSVVEAANTEENHA